MKGYDKKDIAGGIVMRIRGEGKGAWICRCQIWQMQTDWTRVKQVFDLKMFWIVECGGGTVASNSS